MNTKRNRETNELRALTVDEIQAVAGGSLGSAISRVIANLGQALATAARAG